MIRDLIRDPAKSMPVEGDAGQVTALRIWHCKYRSLAGVARYLKLETLVVASYPDIDLEALGALERLEYLSLVHLPEVHDLAPLSRLKNLRTLRLSTLPSWDSSGKTTLIASLAPLAELPALAHVELFGIRTEERSLRDLQLAPALRSVRVSKYPKGETKRFYSETGISDSLAPDPPVTGWN